MSAPRLVGGVHRDVSGRANDPLRFFLSIDRRLASGKLDDVEVDEQALIRLVIEAGQALELLRKGCLMAIQADGRTVSTVMPTPPS